ncbi:unnamed protein product [Heterobilharzia americana]|nr:unnamed protein product [Heterobilharzia americana]
MFIAKSHSMLFTMNIMTAITSLLIAGGGGAFMLSEEMNLLLLRKTIKILHEHVNPRYPNYGNGVGKLIMALTEKFSIVIFTFGFVNFLVCLVGLFAVCNQKSTVLTVYQILLGLILIGHLTLLIGYYYNKQNFKDHLGSTVSSYMIDYISLRSGTSASILAGIIMAMLNCCGFDDYRYYWETPNFNPMETYDDLIYKGLLFPLPCCKMDEHLQIINKTCPIRFTKVNSNVGIGCNKVFTEKFGFYTDMFVLATIVILTNSVIMMCITVKALRDFEPIEI